MHQEDTLQFSVLGTLWYLTTQPILKTMGMTMTMETGMKPQIMEMVEAGMEPQIMVIVEAGMDRQYLGGHCHPQPLNPQVESAEK